MGSNQDTSDTVKARGKSVIKDGSKERSSSLKVTGTSKRFSKSTRVAGEPRRRRPDHWSVRRLAYVGQVVGSPSINIGHVAEPCEVEAVAMALRRLK